MAKKIYAQAPFTILVAGPAGRTSFTNQLIMDSSNNNQMGHLQGTPGSSSLQITISDANFTADVQATVTLTVGAPLAGDTLTVGGVTLTGIAGARTPGNDDFNVGAAVVADEIAAALNDALNSFATLVTAASVAPVVTLTAVPAGADGNAIAVSSSTAQLVFSTPTLSGGRTGGNNTLTFGDQTVTSSVDWIPVNGNANASAIALAAAIDSLPNFSAAAIAADITVTGPTGPSEIEVSVTYTASGGNYTFTPDTKIMTGTPSVGAPIIH